MRASLEVANSVCTCGTVVKLCTSPLGMTGDMQPILCLLSPMKICDSLLASIRLACAFRGRGANPIAHVMQAIGEKMDLIEYDKWQIFLPEGTFMTKVSLPEVVLGLSCTGTA